jgi:hypothetical protein
VITTLDNLFSDTKHREKLTQDMVVRICCDADNAIDVLSHLNVFIAPTLQS